MGGQGMPLMLFLHVLKTFVTVIDSWEAHIIHVYINIIMILIFEKMIESYIHCALRTHHGLLYQYSAASTLIVAP